MENFGLLMDGFGIALTPMHIMLMVGGVLRVFLGGVLPGLGAPNGVSLLIPLTFSMEPVSASILWASMY
ncbi:tripartite tricarboxylate transporter permease, partial [Rhizobium ruizarguesonis]